MEKEVFDSMCDPMLSPADFITLMFERTDEDGILYIPGWGYTRPGWGVSAPGSTDVDNSYRCRIDWNLSKYERVLQKFGAVYAAFEKIARRFDELEDAPENAAAILGDPTLYSVWYTYLRELDDGEFDMQKYGEIYDKLDAMEEVKDIAARLAKGEQLSDFDKEWLTEYMDISITEEERKYRQDYLSYRHREAEKRLGANICANDLLYRAWRLCKLLSLNAPPVIINNEAREFAAAFVLHEYGVSREIVDNTIRLRLEQLEQMSEEELDELYRPQKTNTRKSMAPLFVYDILSKKSDSKTHLRQQDILKELKKYPYEISLERKALSRILHNLIDTSQYAVFSDKTGVWVDRESKPGR